MSAPAELTGGERREILTLWSGHTAHVNDNSVSDNVSTLWSGHVYRNCL